jgi:hypothetical protein
MRSWNRHKIVTKDLFPGKLRIELNFDKHLVIFILWKTKWYSFLRISNKLCPLDWLGWTSEVLRPRTVGYLWVYGHHKKGPLTMLGGQLPSLGCLLWRSCRVRILRCLCLGAAGLGEHTPLGNIAGFSVLLAATMLQNAVWRTYSLWDFEDRFSLGLKILSYLQRSKWLSNDSIRYEKG